MSAYIQLCEYNENRMSLIINNSGPDVIYVSTSTPDLSLGNPVGIMLPVDNMLEFSWMMHGELVWQSWYANCTRSYIPIWEWNGIPLLDECVPTPMRSKMDMLPCRPKKRLPNRPRPPVYPCISQRIFLDGLFRNNKQECECKNARPSNIC